MSKIKNLFSRLKNIPRTRYITFLAVIVLAVSIAIPTLSRYKNRIDINALLSDENNWDGTVASSYRSGKGTSSDPYIISNAKELAYFEKMLNETNYENTYFELSNDIIINNGLFDYDEENIILETNMGMIMVRGFNLHINKLSIESSELIIEGEICSVTYHDEGSSKKGSFFKKMFR